MVCGHDYCLEGVRKAVIETLGHVETLNPPTHTDPIGSLWWKSLS
jgi:hypothetical protein